jgi:hypothetical protein
MNILFNKSMVNFLNIKNYEFGQSFYIKIEKDFIGREIYVIYNSDGTIFSIKKTINQALYFLEDNGFNLCSVH